MKEQNKTKALLYVFKNVYSLDIFPKSSFKEFRQANMFFLDGLSIKQPQREFEAYSFYLIAKKMHLPVNRNEIKEFFDLINI
jgi:hypothetical protein